MGDDSATRVARHRQRYEMIIRLYEMALARNPEVAQFLGTEIATILDGDKALEAAFNDLFDRRPRATPMSLSTSPLLTSVSNAQSTVSHGSLTVSHGRATVSNGRLSGVKAAALAPSPTPLPPTGGKGREPDLHWESLERALGPCRGPKERAQRNGACAEFKQAGITPEEIDTIAERWPSTMGFVMTANGMLKYAGQVLSGPQLRQHKQYLNETGTVKHQPKMNLE